MATTVCGATFVYTSESVYFYLGVTGTEDFDVFACVPNGTKAAYHSYAHMEIEKWIVVGNGITLHAQRPTGDAWSTEHWDPGIFLGAVTCRRHARGETCLHQLCGIISSFA